MCIDALDKDSFGLDSGGSSVKFLRSQNSGEGSRCWFSCTYFYVCITERGDVRNFALSDARWFESQH